jgi:glutamate N-acetyltransferase/amino-acid N-acetyltransferase
LVKAAVHGRDANWGRVVAAAGNAGVAMDQAAIGTKMAGYTLLEKGNVTATAERQSAVARAIRSAFVDRNTVTIEVDLAAGKSSGMAWTCDLSAEYVSINADYRS